MIAKTPLFTTGRAFSVALGRLASTPDALQTAVQHAAMHALHCGQVTPINRFRATLASAHMLGSIGARAALHVLAEAVSTVATIADDGQYRVKSKGRAEYLTLDMAIAAAALLDVPARIAVLQAEAAAARDKAKAAKKNKTEAPASPGNPAVSLLGQLAELAIAEANPSSAAGPVDMRTACPLAATLASQPGALSALAAMVTRAFTMVADSDAASLASMRDAYATGTEQEKARAASMRDAQQAVRDALASATNEADSVHAEALKLAEAAQAARTEAATAHEAATKAYAEANTARTEALAMLADAETARANASKARKAATRKATA